jgi:type IV secretion/conjugal transfer VirB4 family ATPase
MIEFTTYAVAAVGLILLALLAARILQTDQDKTLDKYRKKTAGMVDLLNYAALVDDGVIVNKNGSFMASWIYKGDDNASSTDAQRELVSFRINQALSSLGNGWMIHVDAVRREAPNYNHANESSFPDQISAAIDEERRQLFNGMGNLYEGFFVLTVTYYPPLLAEAKFIEFMFDDDADELDAKSRTHSLISEFKRNCLSIESGLESVFKMKRLKSYKKTNEDGSTYMQDDMLRFIQYCVTGKNHPVNVPSNPMYIDQLIGSEELHKGITPKIGRKFIQVVSIEGFPLESYPGLLSRLAELPVEYRWNSRFIFMDQHEALSHIDKYRKKWKQKIRGFFSQVFNTNSGAIDEDAVNMVADAGHAMAEINSGLISMGYYTSVVVLMDEDRGKVENSARIIEKQINNLGFAARIETINTMDAFMGSLPSHGVENVRRPLLNTMNLADLLPSSTIWTGQDKAPCPFYPPNSPPLAHCITAGNSPFRLNLHVSDVGHTLVFGPTGAGKSTLLALIAAQARRYKNMNIFAFDKGNSLFALTKACGGQHFTIAGDEENELNFCPLEYLETKEDRGWAMEWIDSLLVLNGLNTTPQQRNEIGNAIVSMSQTGSKTFTDFVSSLQDSSMREALHQYTIEGQMGHLLDAASDGLSLSDFNVFEIEKLMELGEKYTLPVLLYLFRRIEKSLNGQPAIIFLDEAWIMLGHPAFREKIREWLKVLRKANCLVFMATQSLTDAVNSGILDVLVESTSTKIYLPNPTARDEETAAIYKRMGLNQRQIEIIATAKKRKQYYYYSDQGVRLFELALGKIALAFVAASDKETIAFIKQLEHKHGSNWVSAYLKSKNIKLPELLGDFS